MQQASTPTGKVSPDSGKFLPPGASAGSPRFVINLCASTTPVGLVQPTHAGLKRFTFFVSRRLEEGRERFRLHMGYFDSQEEAENILDLVRDVYPAAWAGVAPGIKLRSRIPAPAVAAAVPAPAPVPPVAPPVEAAAAAAPAVPLTLELVPDPPRVVTPPVATPPVETPPAATPPAATLPAEATAADADSSTAARSLDNIRAAIDSLGDEAPSVTTPSPPPPAALAAAEPLDATSVLRMLEATGSIPVVQPPPSPSPPSSSLSPSPAARRTAAAPLPAPQPKPVATGVTVRKPVAAPATGKALPPQPDQAVYAVQLLWSVQPIDMNQVPQLAIFSAYTLYGAEGNRDGRRWYGLRLGFFTDAVSAKQVAQYVRSEFNSVSVVPVTARERDRAGTATAKPLPAVSSAKRAGIELNFIEDVPTDTATSGSRPALQPGDSPGAEADDASARAMAAVGMNSRATPGKRAKLRVAQGMKPVSKRPVGDRSLSLEETLEVLGAGQLEIDNGRGEFINEPAPSARKPTTRSGSRFGRLINRLAERLGNG